MKIILGNREKAHCIGCGLCESYFGYPNADVKLGSDGFFSPNFNLSEAQFGELSHFCPVDVEPSTYSDHVWGERCFVCLGHAADEEVRRKASSGGILTALCCYMLDQGLADGIIQLGDSSEPLQKTTRISKTRAEILACSGSRYIAAKPLEKIVQMLSAGTTDKYAVIGRPCDIRALRSFLNDHREYQQNVVCTMSFFCAGTPSVEASKRMIAQMGLDSSNITHISYRGNGWPGFSTVIDQQGKTYQMNYEDSWGKILGRDIYRGCRFCYDGIGEEADVACGDAWYLDEQGKVKFDERPGRNVIFSRTEVGAALVHAAEGAGYISCQSFDERELDKMQPYQFVRRAQLYYKLLAMRTAGRTIPAINMKELAKYGKRIAMKDRMKAYAGTLKRIMDKRI